MLESVKVIDLFCGVGGLSCGLKQAGLNVVAGYDMDNSCKWAYEKNIGAKFVKRNIKEVLASELLEEFREAKCKILVGCVPCQTFSRYTQSQKLKVKKANDERWFLLDEFLRLIVGTSPDVIVLENVPNLLKYPIFEKFKNTLQKQGYYIDCKVIFCPNYGIPQNRERLILIASKKTEIKIPKPTCTPKDYKTLRDAIGHLKPLQAGEQDNEDKLHIASNLSPLNLKRIKATPKDGGSWRDWSEELRLKCHKKQTGKSYGSVYGRMKWDTPAPTMTTFCTGFGNGRFGHPEQDRAISLREASLLQSFPMEFDFIEDKGKKPKINLISRQIGNAVPPKLGEVIGYEIKSHLGCL